MSLVHLDFTQVMALNLSKTSLGKKLSVTHSVSKRQSYGTVFVFVVLGYFASRFRNYLAKRKIVITLLSNSAYDILCFVCFNNVLIIVLHNKWRKFLAPYDDLIKIMFLRLSVLFITSLRSLLAHRSTLFVRYLTACLVPCVHCVSKIRHISHLQNFGSSILC